MIESNAANVALHFAEFLAKVEQGETIRIRDRGRMVARMVPDCDFMPGPQAAGLFRGHRADPEAADAIASELKIEKQWTNEAIRRRDEFRMGRIKAVPASKVFRRMERLIEE